MPESNETTLGSRIKAARLHQRYSQLELARRARMEQSYLSKLERDVGVRPGADVLRRLADALGVTYEDLLVGPPNAAEMESPPLDELRAVGWPEHRVARLEKIWSELTAGERAGHIRRAHTMYLEWEKLEKARRHLQAETDALDAELDRAEPFEGGTDQAFTLHPKPI